VAGNNDEIGLMRGDQLAHQIEYPGDQHLLIEPAVGKTGIVSDVNVAGIGPRRDHLTIDRKAAKTGIEHQDGWRGSHTRNRCTMNVAGVTARGEGQSTMMR